MLLFAWLSAHLAEAKLWRPVDTMALAIAWLGIGTLGAFIWLMENARVRIALPARVSPGPALWLPVTFLITAWLVIAPSRVAIQTSESINRSLRDRQKLLEDARALGFLDDSGSLMERCASQNYEEMPPFMYDPICFCKSLQEDAIRFEAVVEQYSTPLEVFLAKEIETESAACKHGTASASHVNVGRDTGNRTISRIRRIATSYGLTSIEPVESRIGPLIIGLFIALSLVTAFRLWIAFGIRVILPVFYFVIVLGVLGRRFIENSSMEGAVTFELTSEMWDFVIVIILASVISGLVLGLLVFGCTKRGPIGDYLIAVSLSIPCVSCIAMVSFHDFAMPWQPIRQPSSDSMLRNIIVFRMVICWLAISPLVDFGLARHARKSRRV